MNKYKCSYIKIPITIVLFSLTELSYATDHFSTARDIPILLNLNSQDILLNVSLSLQYKSVCCHIQYFTKVLVVWPVVRTISGSRDVFWCGKIDACTLPFLRKLIQRRQQQLALR